MREFENPWRLSERRRGLSREEKSARDRDREWQAECAERRLRADFAWERFKAAFMRGDFAPRQKAGFNPSQPRVPAGNPDGGEWTDGNGAQSADDPQLVQDRTDRLLNNHIIRDHVAKTDEELKARIRAD